MGEVSGIFPSSGRDPHGLKAGRNVRGRLRVVQKLSLDAGKPRALSQRHQAIAQPPKCSRCPPSCLSQGSNAPIHICTLTLLHTCLTPFSTTPTQTLHRGLASTPPYGAHASLADHTTKTGLPTGL